MDQLCFWFSNINRLSPFTGLLDQVFEIYAMTRCRCIQDIFKRAGQRPGWMQGRSVSRNRDHKRHLSARSVVNQRNLVDVIA